MHDCVSKFQILVWTLLQLFWLADICKQLFDWLLLEKEFREFTDQKNLRMQMNLGFTLLIPDLDVRERTRLYSK